MFTYQINDMTCGHCASAITKAVLAVDGGAKVNVDLGQHLVHIESSGAADDTLRRAIQAAGYEPVVVKPTHAGAEAPPARGCCCGTGAARCST